MKMRTLTHVCFVVVMVFCYCTSASRITFEASPRTIYPVLTKILKLRCAVKSSTMTIRRQYTRNIYDFPIARQAISRTVSSTTTAASTITAVFTPVTASASTLQTPATQVEVSHIVSIIVSRQDRTTREQQKVASLSSFDPPTANTDFDRIKVDGHSNMSPIVGEQGYLEITWEYPVSEQSGIYTCEVFALDSTQHPVSIFESVQISSSEPTLSELTSVVTQNDKYVTELRKTVSDLTEQLSALKLQNTTEPVNDQNIQIGNDTCYSGHVIFPKPYKNIPTVLISVNSFEYQSSQGRMDVQISEVNNKGFDFYCSITYVSVRSIMWIATES